MGKLSRINEIRRKKNIMRAEKNPPKSIFPMKKTYLIPAKIRGENAIIETAPRRRSSGYAALNSDSFRLGEVFSEQKGRQKSRDPKSML